MKLTWRQRVLLYAPGYALAVPTAFCLVKAHADIWTLGLILFAGASGLWVGLTVALTHGAVQTATPKNCPDSDSGEG